MAALVILALIALLVVVDTFGRLFVHPDFHVGIELFAPLVGALITILGVEGAARLPWTGPK